MKHICAHAACVLRESSSAPVVVVISNTFVLSESSLSTVPTITNIVIADCSQFAKRIAHCSFLASFFLCTFVDPFLFSVFALFLRSLLFYRYSRCCSERQLRIFSSYSSFHWRTKLEVRTRASDWKMKETKKKRNLFNKNYARKTTEKNIKHDVRTKRARQHEFVRTETHNLIPLTMEVVDGPLWVSNVHSGSYDGNGDIDIGGGDRRKLFN